MDRTELDSELSGEAAVGDGYPLKRTAAFLNDRLGLYLSDEQKKGFATGLLIGTAFAGAVIAWSIGGVVRKSLRG